MSVSVQSLPDGTVLMETPRLILRAAKHSDAEQLHLCFSDPEVMRYWSSLPHKSMEETNVWTLKMVNSQETNGITDFVIILRNNSPTPTDSFKSRERSAAPVIGKIGIYAPLDSSGTGEIGFLLNRSYHRNGLVSEALLAVLGYLFEQKGVKSINTDVDPRNRASIGILEKHGFELTGGAERTMEIGGEWLDSEYRTLTRSRWERMQQSGS